MKPIIQLAILAVSLLTGTFAVAVCANNNANLNVDIKITKPDSLYTDHGDGTVTDNETGLMWRKCPLGLSEVICTAEGGIIQEFTWQAALTAANDFIDEGYSDYSDWRLPNKKELESLVENACYTPAINVTLFPKTITAAVTSYWSSSLSGSYDFNAWTVDFNSGRMFDSNKNTTRYVRLVRGSQSFPP